jgi:hypothetical protein
VAADEFTKYICEFVKLYNHMTSIEPLVCPNLSKLRTGNIIQKNDRTVKYFVEYHLLTLFATVMVNLQQFYQCLHCHCITVQNLQHNSLLSHPQGIQI